MRSRLLFSLLLCLIVLNACGAKPTAQPTQSGTTSTQTEVNTESDAVSDSDSAGSGCSHVFGGWETVQEASEASDGLKKRICALCGKEETEPFAYIPNHEHVYTETVYLPDCTEDGFTQKVCTCGDTVTENVVKASGHHFGDWTTVSAPTTQVEGQESRICEICGSTEKRSVEKLPPVPLFHVHIYTETVYEPTCTEDGYVLMTCACGDYYTQSSGQPAGHDYGAPYRVLDPDVYCGLDRQDCGVCGEIRLTTVPVSDEVPWPTPPTGEDEAPSTDDEGENTSSEQEEPEENDGETPSDSPEKRPAVYYSQRDSRWGNVEMGCGVMKNNGCGPTAIAIALSCYGYYVTPLDVAQWLYEYTIEFNHAFHGISGTGVRLGLEHYGREVVPIASEEELALHLQQGAVVVGCHGQGFFVSKEENSHCIVMVGLDESGNTYCYDPYTPTKNGSYDVASLWAERSRLEVDLRQDGVTHFAVY